MRCLVYKTSLASALILVLAAPAWSDDPGTARQQKRPASDPFAALRVPADDVTRDDGKSFKDFAFTTEQSLAMFRDRLEHNSQDYLSLSMMGQLHERQARETGDLAGFERAEEAYRSALKIRPDHVRSRIGLAGVLCDRHKFAEGLAIAEAILRDDPKLVDALAIQGDANLELGRYAEAEALYTELRRTNPWPEILARVAHLAELKGQIPEAIQILDRAEAAARRLGEPAAGIAWYHVRLGDLHFNAGQLDHAERHYQAVRPGVDPYHDATFGLGQVQEARGQLDDALALYKQAVAIGPDPRMLAALGDLALDLGHTAEAEAAYTRLESVTRSRPEYSRALANYYADHDRQLAESLRLAESDLSSRKDIYGYDTLAWALLKNDRPREARAAIEQALKLGTRDARLHFHAGLIDHRLGREAEARRHLRLALDLNPHFSRRDAARARSILSELGATLPR